VSPREKEALAADLRWRFVRDCQAGGLRPGDLLPSVNELTARYGASLAIARDLYRQLEAEGAVEAFQGKGVLLRGRLEADARPRALRLGVVAYLDFDAPAHIHNRAANILATFERRSAELGGSSRLFNLHPGHDVTLEILESIKAARLDGLLFLPPYDTNPEPNLRKLQMLDLPLVVAGCPTGLTHCVDHDHRQAAAVATAHLLSLGLDKPALLQRRYDVHWTRERLESFKSSGGGLVFEVDCDPDSPGLQDEVGEVLRKLRGAGVRCVLCSGDPYAAALLKAAKAQGVRVPEELAVASIDDLYQFRPLNLTTVQLSSSELSAATYELLAEVVAKSPANRIERRLPGSLIIRDTTPSLLGAGR